MSHHNQLILAINQMLNGCFSDSNGCFPGFTGSSDCGQEVKQSVMKVRFLAFFSRNCVAAQESILQKEGKKSMFVQSADGNRGCLPPL